MKSLKQVLEMKNQQIHQQEKKIIELEKLVSWSISWGKPSNLTVIVDVNTEPFRTQALNPLLPPEWRILSLSLKAFLR